MTEKIKEIADAVQKLIGEEDLKEILDPLYSELLKRTQKPKNETEQILNCIHNVSMFEDCKKCKKETK